MMMTSAGGKPMLFHTISSSQQWELRVEIVDLDMGEPLIQSSSQAQSQQQQRLRVSGDTHIGGVICQLVEKMASTHASMSRQDWSDYALWWPDKSIWLSKTKQTLDQYGVQADAVLHFTRMHKPLRVQLPDLQLVHLPAVDFSLPLFYVVKAVCKELHLRHAEELSFLRLASHAKLIERVAALDIKSNRNHDSDNDGNRDSVSSNSTLNNSSGGSSSSNNNSNNNNNVLLNNNKNNTKNNFKLTNNNTNEFQTNNKFVREMSNTLSIDSHNTIDADYDIQSLAFSPILQTQDVLAKSSTKFKTLFDKTRINNKWLDSSKSLLEQNIKEDDLVQLRFKYYAYFDLNLKHDMVRINQIYEQAKWSILSEEIDCTEQEWINFAALQLQIQLQTKSLNFGSDTIDYSSTSNRQQAATTTALMSQTSVINRTNSLDLDTNGLKSKLLKSSSKIIDEEDDLDTALNKLEKSLDIDEKTSSMTASAANNVTNKTIELTPNPVQQQQQQVQHQQQSVEEKGGQQQQQQETSSSSSSNSNEQLAEYLILIKPHKYTTFKKLKQYYFTLSDIHYLSYYKSREDSSGRPVDKINLKSCELLPDVSLSSRKFGITIRIPSSDGMSDVCLRCPDECSYARWMSALKLASKMRPISDPAFAIEVKSILNLLNMQVGSTLNSSKKATTTPIITTTAINNNSGGISTTDGTNLKSSIKSSLSASFQSIVATSNESAQVQATNLLPARMLKKHKLKQLNDRILEAYSTISDLDIFESKLRYIKNWQALPNYGISYFAVKIKGSKFREELIGIASNRLLRVSPEGETLKSWRFNTMKSWNVNWDINQFEITFDDDELVFLCLNCDAKILHEFIGGYIYLSLRPKLDNNNLSSNLNEEMFFKLTEKR